MKKARGRNVCIVCKGGKDSYIFAYVYIKSSGRMYRKQIVLGAVGRGEVTGGNWADKGWTGGKLDCILLFESCECVTY